MSSLVGTAAGGRLAGGLCCHPLSREPAAHGLVVFIAAAKWRSTSRSRNAVSSGASLSQGGSRLFRQAEPVVPVADRVLDSLQRLGYVAVGSPSAPDSATYRAFLVALRKSCRFSASSNGIASAARTKSSRATASAGRGSSPAQGHAGDGGQRTRSARSSSPCCRFLICFCIPCARCLRSFLSQASSFSACARSGLAQSSPVWRRRLLANPVFPGACDAHPDRAPARRLGESASAGAATPGLVVAMPSARVFAQHGLEHRLKAP